MNGKPVWTVYRWKPYTKVETFLKLPHFFFICVISKKRYLVLRNLLSGPGGRKLIFIKRFWKRIEKRRRNWPGNWKRGSVQILYLPKLGQMMAILQICMIIWKFRNKIAKSSILRFLLFSWYNLLTLSQEALDITYLGGISKFNCLYYEYILLGFCGERKIVETYIRHNNKTI